MYLKQSHLVVSQLPRFKITEQELLTLDNIVKTRRFWINKVCLFQLFTITVHSACRRVGSYRRRQLFRGTGRPVSRGEVHGRPIRV
jgi:hypothetical protein